MLKDISTLLRRTRATLIQDALGAVVLVTLLVGSLYIPAFA